jgi:hypothetical protein
MAWAAEWAKEGVAVDWQRLLPPKASWCCLEKVGGRKDVVMDRPQQEDEQSLREVVCERRSVRVRCDDPPHEEAPCPPLRPIHTVSEGGFCEVHMA